MRSLLTFAQEERRADEPARAPPIVERADAGAPSPRDLADPARGAPVRGDDALVCDADQVQALVALFVNAVEAMPQGGTLRVRWLARRPICAVSVADTGTGIPPDILEHIFQSPSSTKDRQEVGLGLAVVHGIVQRHGGNIEVESEVHRGTAFHLILPRRPSRAGDHHAGDRARSAEHPR